MSLIKRWKNMDYWDKVGAIMLPASFIHMIVMLVVLPFFINYLAAQTEEERLGQWLLCMIPSALFLIVFGSALVWGIVKGR